MAEEIFQAGIIPSDTDFRHFNLYGKIPGELCYTFFFLRRKLLIYLKQGWTWRNVLMDMSTIPNMILSM